MTHRSSTRVAAVDLGATSVRVCACDLERRPLSYEVVHRVQHQPRRTGTDGRLRWDWSTIRRAVHDGLDIAASDSLASIGIDTWAVDYGLVDGRGELLADPVSYRDERTSGYRGLVDRIGERNLYEINGLQCLPINTIFQLDAEDRDLLDRARRVLTLPELLVLDLTGEQTAETSSAGSTGLVDQGTRTWSGELLDAIGVPRERFPDIKPSGTRVGWWRDIPVHLVAGHDTASAVVGIGANEATPTFVSSGTWLLAGQELDAPLLTEQARRAQFTNEYGPESTTRFLKNIAGFWILEQCRLAWGDHSLEVLLEDAAAAPIPDVTFDATDPRFLAPDDMEAEVLDSCGLPRTTARATTVNLIVNSLARTTAAVIDLLVDTTDRDVESVHLVGGGVRMPLFIDRLRDHLSAPVIVGAAESAALGNAMSQGIALGLWADVADARKSL